MPGRIPQSFIDDLLTRIDIVEIINTRVQLRKTGSNYSARCPFHDEKTPSFTVSPNKQFYYCFGCGAHGNAISFIMNFDNMEFLDALETLAASVGLEVPREDGSTEQKQAKELYTLLDQANRYYQQQLKASATAINYLKSRSLSGIICKRFNIGYAPEGWDNLHNKLNNSKDLLATGMLLQKNGKAYDRFRDRIMFPIKNQRGHIIGFGGRTLGDDTPKYLNSPETEIFHKGQELYGLYEAKQQNHSLDKILVVEGYMDVVSLAQHGIDYAVATLGTATTQKHVQKLLRYTKKIIFCFDGDRAGKAAAQRAMDHALPLMRDDIQIGFLFLPESEDPDSQVQKVGKEQFTKDIDNAIPLSELFFKQLREQYNTETLDGRTNLAKAAITHIANIPNGIFKTLMLQQLAEIVHLDLEQLELNTESKEQTPPQELPLAESNLVYKSIKIVLHNPQLSQYISDLEQLKTLHIKNIRLLCELIELAQKQPKLSTGAILEHWRDKEGENILAKLASEKFIVTDLKNELLDTISYLHKQNDEAQIQQLLQKANQGTISKEEKQKLHDLLVGAKINNLEETK